MALKTEKKRNKAGDNLEAYENKINQTFAMLDSIKVGLSNLKVSLESDLIDFTAADVTEVDDVITLLDSKYTP